MSLTIEEIAELETSILKEFPYKITEILIRLNGCGRLEEFLDMINMSNLLEREDSIQSYKDGKIVVVGGTEVKEKALLGIAKDMGIDKERFEFCLDYDDIQKFDFRKMQYEPKYRVILFGPTPHSGHGKSDSGSIIAGIEKEPGYPRVERLMSGNKLKITKSNFKEKLEQLKAADYI